MDSWPTATEELRAVYEELASRHAKHRIPAEMARTFGVSVRTVHNRLATAGIRPIRAQVQRPAAADLKAAHEAVVTEHGQRGATGKLAAMYGVTTTTIRQWLCEEGLYTPKPRIPAKPIAAPCPCGAVATTRYKGKDPALCFRCYMRTYATDKESNFRRTAREYIAEVKRNAICVDCCGSFPPCVYHFDHVPERGPKLFNLGSGDYSIAAVQAEIAKCDIVCANCHAIRTWVTRAKPWIKKGPKAS